MAQIWKCIDLRCHESCSEFFKEYYIVDGRVKEVDA